MKNALIKLFAISVFAALAFCGTTLAQSCPPSADYRFQNTRASSVGSAPALTDIGAGANTFQTDSVAGASRGVLQFPQGNGVQLQPTTGVIANDAYTIVVLFKFADVNGYKRIVDFKNNTSDKGLYVQSGYLNFFNSGSGSDGPIAADTYVQVALTRTAAGVVTGYVNGVPQFSFNDTANDAVIDSNNALIFFKDNTSGGGQGEESAGSVARIRLYNCVLTASDVAALAPNPPPPPASTCAVNSNLLADGDAEADQSAIGDGSDVDVSGWELETGTFTVIRYDTNGLSPIPGPVNRGNYLFAGGFAVVSNGSQTIDVSGCAAQIDTGNQTFSLNGFLGGFSGQDDNARLTITFINAADAALGTATIGPVTATDRGNDDSLLFRLANGKIPAGTRSVQAVLLITKTSGSFNDGYADNLSFRLTKPTSFDFDADGKSDLSVFRPNPDPANNQWYFLNSLTGAFSSQEWGIQNDTLAPADYDGDGKTDIAVWRDELSDPNRATFYILQSATNTFRGEQFGRTGDNPSVVGDWDNDGKADPAVYRNGVNGGQSYFFYRPSTQPNVSFIVIPWGSANDKPMRGDFDGDGKFDAAVFRPSNNFWYILQSSNNQIRYDKWGLGTDKFVPADYDADGKTDLAVYRGGVWYIKQSANGQPSYKNWGLDSDALVPADYDGDGKIDVAVFRNGIFYILQSTTGQPNYQYFGLTGDIPVASSFVQ